jgi:hypothetical protein
MATGTGFEKMHLEREISRLLFELDEREAQIRLLEDLESDVECGPDVLAPKTLKGKVVRIPLFLAQFLVDAEKAEWVGVPPYVDVGELTRMLREEEESSGLQKIDPDSLLSALTHVEALRQHLEKHETHYVRMKYERMLTALREIVAIRVGKALRLASRGATGVDEKLGNGERELIGEALKLANWWSELMAQREVPTWKTTSRSKQEDKT